MHIQILHIVQLCTTCLPCRAKSHYESATAFQECTSCPLSHPLPNLHTFPSDNNAPPHVPLSQDTLSTRLHSRAFSKSPIASHPRQSSIVDAAHLAFHLVVEASRPPSFRTAEARTLRFHHQHTPKPFKPRLNHPERGASAHAQPCGFGYVAEEGSWHTPITRTTIPHFTPDPVAGRYGLGHKLG